MHNSGANYYDSSIGMAADSQEDGTQNNQGGTGDGANFGMFNLNWYMIRSSPGCGDLSGLSEGEWTRGTELNTNEQLAVQCMKATRTHFGDDWWGYQRSVHIPRISLLSRLLAAKTRTY